MDATHFVGDDCPGGHADVPMSQSSGHDPMCVTPYKQQATCGSCALVTRVRADEGARVHATLVALENERDHLRGDLSDCRHWAKDTVIYLAHAEAVAAKLVEVICDDAAVMAWDLDALEATTRERDAARAEVDRLNIEIGKVVDSRERTRVEIGQKVIDANREAALAHAEVAALREMLAAEIREADVARRHAAILADLRADLTARLLGRWDRATFDKEES